ncbi:MAG TPA: sulfatase-like hydrolase/transferase [Terriglobia bacterium]|nr:sulfatase-like hydrolase/transferase [Terriglobia bacterium]
MPATSLLKKGTRLPRQLFLGLLGATLLKLAYGGLPRPAPQTKANSVILITVDTLRADHVGCYGARTVKTPAMDALAAQGTRFDNALTCVPITVPSHAAILSGTYPMWNGMRDFTSPPLQPGVGLLAEAFERHGYTTAAFVSAFVLDSSWGLSRGFQTYDDQFDPHQFETRNPGNVQRRAKETVDHLLAWFKSQEPGSATKPYFVWLHLYDPHSPYDPPEPFHARYKGHLYDGEIAYVDSQLGRLFDYLRQTGTYDRSAIILMSDHGESLGEHGEDEHGFFIYRSTLRVPIIVKLPRGEAGDQAGRVVKGPVSTVDVAPTLLELAHLQDPLSRQFQGISLAAWLQGKTPATIPPIYAESYYSRDSFGWSPLRSITNARYEFIQAPHPELYDNVVDPAQKHNVIEQHGADAAALRDQLQVVERRFMNEAAGANPAPSISPDAAAKLRSLGYVAYSAPAIAGDESALPDPKDRVQVFRSILRAEDLAAAGEISRSDALLNSLRPSEPNLYLIPFMLGENAAKEHRWPDAEKNLVACVKLNPTFDQAIMALGRVTYAEGKLEPARAWLELALSQNPHNFLAHHGLGLVAQAEQHVEEAQREFEAALKEKPDYAPALQALGVTLVEARRYSDALPRLESAESQGVDDAVLFNYLGTAYLNTNQPQKAIVSYRKALALKGDYKVARLNLAFAYLKAGNHQDGLREFHSLCAQDHAMCQQYEKYFQ